MATAGLVACNDKRNAASAGGEVPAGQMTYRSNPSTGDKVSLLGFGMMRLPSVGGRSAREGNEDIDQEMVNEMVNEMVDYALAHGVNYFDTSPAYCRGMSEKATGIALARHPRDTYFIATKLSNFAPATWKREEAIAMYRNSMKDLQVDYIDYYLLHGIGMGGGMEEYEKRYVDNGVLDFLLEERKAGRIRNLGFSYHGDIAVFDRLLAEHDKYQWDFVQIQLNYLDWKYANMRSKSIRATPMPNTCTTNWRSATSLPSLWNRCWADGFPMCRTTSWRCSNSANRSRAWLRGRSVLPEVSPMC